MTEFRVQVQQQISHVSCSPNGRLIGAMHNVGAQTQGTIEIWPFMRQGEGGTKIETGAADSGSLFLTMSDRLIATGVHSGDGNGWSKIYDIETGRFVIVSEFEIDSEMHHFQTVAEAGNGELWDGRFSRNGMLFYHAQQNSRVVCFDLRTGTVALQWNANVSGNTTMHGAWGPVRTVAPAPDGIHVAWGGWGTSDPFKISDLRMDGQIVTSSPKPGVVDNLQWHPKGRLLIASWGHQNSALFDTRPDDGFMVPPAVQLEGKSKSVTLGANDSHMPVLLSKSHPLHRVGSNMLVSCSSDKLFVEEIGRVAQTRSLDESLELHKSLNGTIFEGAERAGVFVGASGHSVWAVSLGDEEIDSVESLQLLCAHTTLKEKIDYKSEEGLPTSLKEFIETSAYY